jgi:uncharacterized protein YaaQ
MKLLIAITRDDCAADVTAALNEQKISVTRISSTGGFWRRGNVTLLIGVEERDVERALQTIDANAGDAIQTTPEMAQSPYPPHRATVFMINVDSFAHY